MSLMNLEQKINYQLNKVPAVKKVIKRIYQRTMYAVFPKIRSEGNIIRISPDDPNHEYFFGYYDKSPWDISDRYVLCMRVNDTWSDVSPKETADILLIDTMLSENNNNRVRKIADTRAWNVQQGCMLQWLGPDFSSRILYNDCRNGKYVAVILEIATGKEQIVSAPVYTVSADGKTALTLDFSRLYNLRPGYGYYNVPEKTEGDHLPDSAAVWRINLESGDVEQLLTYKDFANFQPRPEMLEKGSVHKVNHLMLRPDGKRFMVLYRWFIGQRKYSRLVTCNVDGKNMYVLSDDDMVSHCCWKNNEIILAYENKRESGPGYYLMKDKSQEYIHCWPQLNNDGHPSYSPDKGLIVTDTYPGRTRIAEIKLMDGRDEKKREVNVIARVFAPFRYDDNTRCDLRPCWNHAGDKICFDGVFEGHRGIYNCIVKRTRKSKEPVKVLYIVDNLLQRSGVTSVIMNYFRYIDKSEVSIDFLVWRGNDRVIEDEIRLCGSKIYYMPKLGMKNFSNVLCFIENFFTSHQGEYYIIHSHFYQMDTIIFPSAKKHGVKYCISHSHNTKFSDYRLRSIRNRMMCLRIKKYADIWAACSTDAGVKLFGKEFLTSARSKLIHNAIEIKKFNVNSDVRKKVREDFHLDEDIVLLGNIGSLKPQKNQMFLIEIVNRLVKLGYTKYRLLIVGNGQMKQKLECKIKEYQISRYVNLIGVRKDISDLLQAMDLFLLPSLYEGLPVVGIEAQAAGLRVILSDKITKEVCIADVKYLPINQGVDLWVNEITEYHNHIRISYDEKMTAEGYSIENEAEKLTCFYRGMVKSLE